MDFQLFGLGQGLDDRQLIARFIAKTVALLGDFLDDNQTNFVQRLSKVSPDLGNRYTLAFQEVTTVINPMLNEAGLNWIDTEKLQRAGLTGQNLQLKAQVLNLFGERLPNGNQRLLLWDRGINRVVRKFLDFLNKVLSSLATAVPIVEILKEFKDLIEAGIDLGEDVVEGED